eukprot:scaffold207879_cov35-Tisochrysis_lutea.AAC.3
MFNEGPQKIDWMAAEREFWTRVHKHPECISLQPRFQAWHTAQLSARHKDTEKLRRADVGPEQVLAIRATRVNAPAEGIAHILAPTRPKIASHLLRPHVPLSAPVPRHQHVASQLRPPPPASVREKDIARAWRAPPQCAPCSMLSFVATMSWREQGRAKVVRFSSTATN